MLDLENHIVDYADHSESYYDEEDFKDDFDDDCDDEFDDIEKDDDIEE